MWLVAGVYLEAWQCVSDGCGVYKCPDQRSPCLIVYLHVEARPRSCKTILRHRGGCELIRLDLMGLHAEGGTLCHVRRHNRRNQTC